MINNFTSIALYYEPQRFCRERAAEAAAERRRAGGDTENTVGLSWQNFDRDSMQPKPTRFQSVAAGLAGTAFSLNGAFCLTAHLLGYEEVALIGVVGLPPLGACFFFNYGQLKQRLAENAWKAELVRRLDAGEYVPRPPLMDNSGGGGS